jgi:hypothetical protein
MRGFGRDSQAIILVVISLAGHLSNLALPVLVAHEQHSKVTWIVAQDNHGERSLAGELTA